MGFRMRGNTSALKALSRKLDQAGRIPDRIGGDITNAADPGKTFDRQADPYGKRWSRRKRASAGKLLNVTGALRGSLNAAWAAGTLTVSAGADYASFHQRGTSRMVARMILPSRSQGLPPDWESGFQDAYADAFNAVF